MQTVQKEVKVKGKIIRRERVREEFPMLTSLDTFKKVVHKIDIEVVNFNQEFWPSEMLYIQEYALELQGFAGVFKLKVAAFKGVQEEWEYDLSLKAVDSTINEQQAQKILRIFIDMFISTEYYQYEKSKEKILSGEPLAKTNLIVTVL